MQALILGMMLDFSEQDFGTKEDNDKIYPKKKPFYPHRKESGPVPIHGIIPY